MDSGNIEDELIVIMSKMHAVKESAVMYVHDTSQ